MNYGDLPCGHKYCPICPMPDLSTVPDDQVQRIPDKPMEKRKRKRPIRNLPHYPADDYDGISASWGMVVKQYESGG